MDGRRWVYGYRLSASAGPGLVVLFGCVFALAAGDAQAAACVPNPVCPYQRLDLLGSATGSIDDPVGVATTPAGDVVVVDHGNHTVQEYDWSGRFVRRLDAWHRYPRGPRGRG